MGFEVLIWAFPWHSDALLPSVAIECMTMVRFTLAIFKLDRYFNNIDVSGFILTGAPTKSNSYEEFGLRLWPNSYQLATMRQLYERDRDVSRIGVLIPPFGGLIPPAPAKISMT
jgi:hypothetical protein